VVPHSVNNTWSLFNNGETALNFSAEVNGATDLSVATSWFVIVFAHCGKSITRLLGAFKESFLHLEAQIECKSLTGLPKYS
jgi:hypothetical protein